MGLVAQNMSSSSDLLRHTHVTSQEHLPCNMGSVAPVVKEKGYRKRNSHSCMQNNECALLWAQSLWTAHVGCSARSSWSDNGINFFLLRNISRIVVLCYLKLFFFFFNFTLTFYLTLIDIYLTVQVTVLFLYALIFSSINIHLIGLEEET